MTWSQRVRGLGRQFVVVGGMIFPWAGLALLLLAGGFGVHSWLFLRHGVRAVATITENVAIQESTGDVFYETHARFRLPSGEIVSFVDPVRSSQDDGPNFPAGAVVPVVYPEGRPEAARIATIWRAYFVAIVLGGLGVFFMDLGLILRRIRQRRFQGGGYVRNPRGCVR